MKPHCLIADPLPSKTPQLDLIDLDYRIFIQFEAASLRVKNDQDAAPLITATLDKFLGAGWQLEYTPQQAFDGLMWFYRAGREEPEPVDTMDPRPPLGRVPERIRPRFDRPQYPAALVAVSSPAAGFTR